MKKLEMTDELKSIVQSIKDGEVYAHIESVSKSGMSRRILFFRIAYTGWSEIDLDYTLPRIQKITAEIGWLSGELKQGEYQQGGKYVFEDGLRVRGCGMDMIFHTLYKCMPYEEAKDWRQKYNLL